MVVAALAQGQTVTAAARSAGVHRATIYDWFKSVPGFTDAVHQAREEFRETLDDGLQDLASKALSALAAILEDPKMPAGPRVRAALAVLHRPQFPNPDWNLPIPIPTNREQIIREDVARQKAESE
jgi:AcrR family transcriptional regulator